MRKLIFLVMLIALPCLAYEVFQQNELPEDKIRSNNEKLLFVIDFSQSMEESLNGETKIDMVKSVMEKYLPEIPSTIPTGLRIYGHKCGFTAYHACKASELTVPISLNSKTDIITKLSEFSPRGMTPITYSLKQAVSGDFGDYKGLKHIVLLTDGGENCDESPCKYAIELSKFRPDFIIDVIAFNIGEQDDLEQLECTALVTKGKFYQADTKSELMDIMGKIIDSKKHVEAQIHTYD